MTAKSKKQTMRASIFLFLAGICRFLPAFRGRDRFFLMLYDGFGLKKKHLHIITDLEKPVQFKAKLDIHSWLQRLAFLTGSYEADEVLFLSRLFSSQGGQGYMLDIGANIGLISIPFALLNSANAENKIIVVAVEAVPDNFRILEENISLNNLQRPIKAVRMALGDVAKTIEIQVEGNLAEGEGTGTANILPDGSNFDCIRQTLDLQTLDHLIETNALSENCSVVKIDTDGYDLKVFQGGIRFLQENRPVVFGEFSAHCLNWHRQSVSDVVEFAGGHGYDVWQRVPATWTFSKKIDANSFKQDLLMVPKEREANFHWCLTTDES